MVQFSSQNTDYNESYSAPKTKCAHLQDITLNYAYIEDDGSFKPRGVTLILNGKGLAQILIDYKTR